MIKQIDRSPFLLSSLPRISEYFARRRGLPVIIGIIFIVIGFVTQLLAVYTDTQWIEVVAVCTHNLGVLIALVGLLIATPLGK